MIDCYGTTRVDVVRPASAAPASIDQDAILEALKVNLSYWMETRGIKPAPLARQAGLNESAVRDIMRSRSRNPGIVTLGRIAAVLGVSVRELVE